MRVFFAVVSTRTNTVTVVAQLIIITAVDVLNVVRLITATEQELSMSKYPKKRRKPKK